MVILLILNLGVAIFFCVFISITVELYVRWRCLSGMLKALGRSSLFSSVREGDLEHQGRLFKTMLLTDIGTALIFSRSNVRTGVLDPADVAEFPRRLRLMAVTFVLSSYASVLSILVCVVLMGLDDFAEPYAYIPWQELALFYSYSIAGLMLAVSVCLSVYAIQCHLPAMLAAIKKDHPYRAKLEQDLRWHGTSWRSILFVLICRTVAANGRKLRNFDGGVFDLNTLPTRLKWVARANIICAWTGIASALIALALYILW